jgi:hypothetical protein
MIQKKKLLVFKGYKVYKVDKVQLACKKAVDASSVPFQSGLTKTSDISHLISYI